MTDILKRTALGVNIGIYVYIFQLSIENVIEYWEMCFSFHALGQVW